MSIHVLQGERELVDDCRSLARFELRGIPPMVAGAAHIRVTYQVDADGLLNVAAKELSTGIESQIQVKPSYGLDDQTITTMLQASHSHAEADKNVRVLREQQVEGRRMVESLQGALQEDGALLSEHERAQLEQQMAALAGLCESDDGAAIKVALESLAEASEDFAARRMDASIQQALKGQSIDDLES